MTYIKSPLNYTGGKYRLLSQILPLFPDKITTFVDLFGGGFNVGVNVKSDRVIYNDALPQVVELLEYLSIHDLEGILKRTDYIIDYYSLSKENKEGYLALREGYNSNPNPNKLYVLICYAFNNQIRFNSKGGYNMPFGKNRSSFNDTLRGHFIKFVSRLNEIRPIFTNLDFREVNLNNLDSSSIVYADPPYLNSVASYNEQNGWSIDDEKDLLELLDKLHERGIKFALSNNLKYDNPLLAQWREKYTTHYLDIDYTNCSYQKSDKSTKDIEVLITNY